MLRGTLGTCTQFATVIGILLSDALAIPLSTGYAWRWLFALVPLLCIIQLFTSPSLIESPKWLLGKDENSVQARVNIKRLRGFRSHDEVENEVENYIYASKKFGSIAHSPLMDIIHAYDIRELVLSAITLHVIQQFCGVSAIFYYSTEIFASSLSHPVVGTVLVAAVNVASTYVALKLMGTTERKSLLLYSSGGALVSLIVLMLALEQIIPPIFALYAMMGFVAFFGIGLGPIPWLIVAEMFPAKHVEGAMAFSCVVNWFCNFLCGVSFPFMFRAVGPLSFAPFCLVLFLGILFTVWYLPETHMKTVEEIQEHFKPSADLTPAGAPPPFQVRDMVTLVSPVIEDLASPYRCPSPGTGEGGGLLTQNDYGDTRVALRERGDEEGDGCAKLPISCLGSYQNGE